MAKKTVAQMMAVCEKLAQTLGYELVDMGIEKESTGQYLRIYLDKQQGITLDDCEKYHRQVQPLVESIDYDFLEVSSPGIDRPLKTEKDFLRSIGIEVEVRLYKSHQGQKKLIGFLIGFEEGQVRLKTAVEELTFALKELALVKPFIDMDGIEEVPLP